MRRTSNEMTRRSRAWLAVAVLSGSVVAVGCGSDAKAPTCAGPVLHVGSTPAGARTRDDSGSLTVAMGSVVFASGERFSTRCGVAGSSVPKSAAPIRGIRIYVVQGKERVSVAQIDAGADDSFTLSFGIPATLAKGSALVSAQLSTDEKAPVLATTAIVID